jgi:hypothetical protein
MTILMPVYLRPSCHRHGERHLRNALPKRLTRRRNGDDAHDADIRAYSRQGMRLYFVGPYPFNLTRRTRRRKQETPFLCSFRAHNCVGFVEPPDNPTPLPDENDGP